MLSILGIGYCVQSDYMGERLEWYGTLTGGLRTEVIVEEKHILSVILPTISLKGVTTKRSPQRYQIDL